MDNETNQQEYIFKGVPAFLVEKLWHFGLPYVKRALDHANGEMSHEDLRVMCINRDAQLWMCKKEDKIIGAGTTEIVNYPQMRVCRILTLAGTEFDNWMYLANNIIELWAIEQDCEAIEAFVRKGFVPKLQKIGFKHAYSVMHKRIKE